MSRSKPLIAIVGRPNVGKSTLVNRIVGRRAAVVQEKPGVTRDRRYFEAEWNGRSFTVIDTGGWQRSADAELVEDIRTQAELAIAAADLIVFVVDAQGIISTDDAAVAALLRPARDRVVVAANKSDNEGIARSAGEFGRMGLGDPVPVSAIHGQGVAELLDIVVGRIPDAAEDRAEGRIPEAAIIGRPNVGKSTLMKPPDRGGAGGGVSPFREPPATRSTWTSRSTVRPTGSSTPPEYAGSPRYPKTWSISRCSGPARC